MRWLKIGNDKAPRSIAEEALGDQRADYYLQLITRMFGLCGALALAICAINLLAGRVYDTEHFGDTQFLLGAAWRVTQGLRPVLDFGHFYGGLLAHGLAWTMLIFGPSVMTLELFAALLVPLLCALSYLILRERVSAYGLTALFLMITILILTRYPLELNRPIIGTVSAHSFLYNRIALALWMVAGLFVALGHARPRREFMPGALVGALLACTMLIKPTFVVIMPAALLALAVQARWSGLGAVSVGAIVILAVVDPWLHIWSGAFAYAMSHVSDVQGAGVSFLIAKSVKLPLSQPIATVFALAVLVRLWSTPRAKASALAILVMATAGIGMAATMAGAGDFGQLGLVLAAYVALAAAEAATLGRQGRSPVLQLVSAGLVASLALPHTLNLAGATLEGIVRGDKAMIIDGPYARYLSVPEPTEGIAVPPSQYEMLADGIMTLRALGEPEGWGIVADSGISFEHALESRPVPGFPLWQRISAPEFGAGQGLPAGADVVMIGRAVSTDPVGAFLAESLPESFMHCRNTLFWEIHIGPDVSAVCDAAPAK